MTLSETSFFSNRRSSYRTLCTVETMGRPPTLSALCVLLPVYVDGHYPTLTVSFRRVRLFDHVR